jgi:hypothetical protein
MNTCHENPTSTMADDKSVHFVCDLIKKNDDVTNPLSKVNRTIFNMN